MARGEIRTIAFDVMDTVLHDPFREALRAATGIDPARYFRQRDPDLYRALERDEITEDVYWERIRASGIDIDPDEFHRVRVQRTRWIDGMPELLADLGGVVERVTASNYPVWIEDLATRLLDEHFEHVLASCHLGVRKPDPGFYEALLARLDRRPGEVLFVDDREANVEAARRCGVRSHRFADVATLRQWLVAEGVPLA